MNMSPPSAVINGLSDDLLDNLLRSQKNLSAHAQPALWLIAYSGGLDSQVLLHAMLAVSRSEAFAQRLQQHQLPMPIIEAVHIDHGLQDGSALWQRHCQSVCEGLKVKLHCVKAGLKLVGNIEAQARKARYQIFADIIQSRCIEMANVQTDSQSESFDLPHTQACVFLAQHQQDQVETFLYRLMRGAGLRGLSGMPQYDLLRHVDMTAFTTHYTATATLSRPFLQTPKHQLQQYAQQQQLSWVEDPSNAQTRFDRNYLRHEILPKLVKRWPQCQARLAKNIGFLQQSQAMLEELAELDIEHSQSHFLASYTALQTPTVSHYSIPQSCLYSSYFLGINQGRARFIQALQRWLRQQSLEAQAALNLTEAQFELLADVIFSKSDRSQALCLEIPNSNYTLQRFKQGLYLCQNLAADSLQAAPSSKKLSPKKLSQTPQRQTQLKPAELKQANHSIAWRQDKLIWHNRVYHCSAQAFDFTVGARPESASMLINGRHQQLKKLLQQAQVPTWQRASLAYLFIEGELVAVGDFLRADSLVSAGITITCE